MIHLLHSLSAYLASSISVRQSNKAPQTVQWSSTAYGEDGPWHAVDMQIGDVVQHISLFPGGSWMTNVVTPSCCPDKGSCGSKDAGFYVSVNSTSGVEVTIAGKIALNNFSSTVGAMPAVYGSGIWYIEKVSIPAIDGYAGNSYQADIGSFDVLAMEYANQTLPDGSTYPVQVGKLGLGAPKFNQSWNPLSIDRYNGTFLPSALFEAGKTPSNSYGMHVGSASMSIAPSLIIGGYDQSRVLGVASSQVYTIDHLPIDLLDIGIGVADGGSPFNWTSKSGLLAAGNSSIGPAVTVLVEAVVPYLYLPQSTCDAITQYLPVTYQEKYGLYFWDVKDPRYATYISSPVYLSFKFRLNSSLTENFSINVPLSLLNLTLTTVIPGITAPTPYLPLRPGLGPSGSYELGRAFMQAAFVGVNWRTDADNGFWFLAQAPGPNTPKTSGLTAIQPGDTEIVSSTNSWKDSWKGVWTVLPGGNGTTGASLPNDGKKTKARLAVGTIVGIAVAAAVIVLVIVILWVHIRRRKRAARAVEPANESLKNEAPYYGRHELDPANEKSRWKDGGPGELGSGFLPEELGTGREPEELDSRHILGELGNGRMERRMTLERNVEMPG